MNTQINQVMLENVAQSNEPPKQFTFDAVYPEDSITENIYTDSVFPLVESVSFIKIKLIIKTTFSFRCLKDTMQLYLLMDKQGIKCMFFTNDRKYKSSF
jgi:hypothetical protein